MKSRIRPQTGWESRLRAAGVDDPFVRLTRWPEKVSRLNLVCAVTSDQGQRPAS